MQRANSLEATLILGKIEGRRKREWQRMKWLDTNHWVDMSFNKLQEMVKVREARCAIVHGDAKCWTKWKSLSVRLFATPWRSPWNSAGQNIGVSSCSLLQGIFPTEGSNPGLPHSQNILNHLSHQGSPDKYLTKLVPKTHTVLSHSVMSDSLWPHEL